jgi:hypothetical protein
MTEDTNDPAEKAERELLARVYSLILSWPDPEEQAPSIPEYCTQNAGDCAACPLARGELDCKDNRFPVP